MIAKGRHMVHTAEHNNVHHRTRLSPSVHLPHITTSSCMLSLPYLSGNIWSPVIRSPTDIFKIFGPLRKYLVPLRNVYELAIYGATGSIMITYSDDQSK